MTREEAIKVVRNIYQTDAEKEALAVLVPELSESEDERISKFIRSLLENVRNVQSNTSLYKQYDDALAWLEKRKENIEKEYVFRPLAGTDITVAAEQAIRKANEGDRLVLAFNGAYIPVRKGVNANKIVDIYDAFIEKQKDASKAIEAVDRIDKYIDEHLANAHDMKDSNPDKKYYRGWDDALGKMAGILQDVYSNEKQKEQKPAECEDCAMYLSGNCIHPNGKCENVKSKQEWSEEDKHNLNSVINLVHATTDGAWGIEYIHRDALIEWLLKGIEASEICESEYGDACAQAYQAVIDKINSM